MIFDMPQIPFEVFDASYKRTVYVVSSCDKKRTDSLTLTVKNSDGTLSVLVFRLIDLALKRPGITRVQVCRKEVSK